MSEYIPGLIWLIVLLALNAFFVAAEFAVISARRSQIEPRAAAGQKSAKTALWAMEHATLMLAACQLGITICSLLILIVAEPALHHLLQIPLSSFTQLGESAISTISFVVALVLVTYLHVVFGEMVPKNTSFSIPERAVLILAPPLVAFSNLMRPIIWVLNEIANGVLRLFKVDPKSEATSTYTLDEVAGIVAQSTREGTLKDTSGTLAGAFQFTEQIVADVDVSLDSMVMLPESATPADLQQAVIDHGHSRYVLVDQTGEPRGYVHMKDVMDLIGESFNQPIPPKRIRALISISRSSEVEDAMSLMRNRGSHLAKTFDDQGKTTGLLFLEDVLEVLIGEIRSASDQ